MTKILIAYSSKTGNTEKLARAIARGVEAEGGEPLVKSAPEVTKEDLVSSDGLIFGSPVYFGSPTAEMKELIDRTVGVRRKLVDKVGAAFTTAGNVTGGKETTLLTMLMAFLIHEMVIVGDPIEAGGHYGASAKGNPSEEEEHYGELLGKRVVKVARKMSA